MFDDLADQRDADDPLRQGTNVKVGQGRREKDVLSDRRFQILVGSPTTLAAIRSAGTRGRFRRSTSRQFECAVGLFWMSGLTFGSVDACVYRHDENRWPQFPPRLASCRTSPQRSGPPRSSPRQSIPADPCAGRCWQLLNHPAS